MDKYPCRLQPNHLPGSPTQNLPIPESTEMPEALTDHSQAGTDMPALSYSMPDTADMTGWLDSDPLLDQNIFRSHAAIYRAARVLPARSNLAGPSGYTALT